MKPNIRQGVRRLWIGVTTIFAVPWIGFWSVAFVSGGSPAGSGFAWLLILGPPLLLAAALWLLTTIATWIIDGFSSDQRP